MQQEPYLKCPCENCGAHIEFPSEGLGQSIACPHCNWKTKLVQPGESSTNEPNSSGPRKRPVWLIALSCTVVLAALSFGILLARKKGPSAPLEKTSSKTNVEEAALGEAPAKKQPARRSKTPAKPEFESNGLQAFRVGLEKSNGRLVYATGTIRNQSKQQRFGVKVELALFDAQGVKLGSTTDYVQVIEPRKEWKFRALVTEPDAVRAKVTALTEE